ncbi:hypothetical protein [Frankia sp. CcWB3]
MADQLAKLSVTAAADLHLLRDIRKIEFGAPIELLRSFRLVDTPGLASLHGVDSANAARYLGITDPVVADQVTDVLRATGRDASAVHADSTAEVDRADAVVFLFSGGVGETDLIAVDRFSAGESAADGRDVNPLKAFGVLSRCDERYWPPGPGLPGSPTPWAYDPMADGARQVVDRLMRDPVVQRHFYTIVPVAGIVASGAQTASSELFNVFADLNRELGLEDLSDLLGPVWEVHRGSHLLIAAMVAVAS